MRLLMVTPRYFPMMGGVETHVYEVARRLARRGVEDGSLMVRSVVAITLMSNS